VALANIDLDTGDHAKRGDYPLEDQTYAQLLARITSRPDQIIPADLKQNLFEYYSAGGTSGELEFRVREQLATLKKMKVKDGLD
jgi:hypothetical protein